MSTTRNPGARRAAVSSAILLAAGLAVAVPGLHSPSSATAEPGLIGSVTGVVVDTTGAPVEGAQVMVLPPKQVPERAVLDPESRRVALTDANGEFQLPQSRRGFLVMVCDPSDEYPGACAETVLGVDHLLRYVGPDGQTDSWMQQTRLFEATTEDLDVGEIEVQEEAVISGTIDGAERELVQLMRGNDTVAFNMRTDGQGNYEFRGLAPGSYYVRAGGQGNLPWQSEFVTIDAEHPADVDGELLRGASVRGTLLEAGEPTEHRAEVFLADADGDWIASVYSTRTGGFEFTGLAPGDYQVGTLRPGGPFLVHGESFTVAEDAKEVLVDVPVTYGARVTVRFDPDAEGRIDNELRDADGDLVNFNLGRGGKATFYGLDRGTYTLVAKDDRHYGATTIRVRKLRAYDAGTLDFDRKLLTLRGKTAPGAVVEATTGSFCPPDAEPEHGGFHEIEKADADGDYVIRDLTPGNYMVAADGFPGNYAPSCHDDVDISTSETFDVPLQPGNVVSGRLVYEGTDRPVIAPLSYRLSHPAGLTTNPTEEHPSVDRVDLPTGQFAVDRVPGGTVTGVLATETSENITSGKFLVYHPYSDGTPYWLETAEQEITVDGDVDLGDVELVLKSGPQG